MNLLNQAQNMLQTQMPGLPTGTPAPAEPAPTPAEQLAPVGEQALDNISSFAAAVARFTRDSFPDITRAERLLLVNGILSFGVIVLAGLLFALCGRLTATFMKKILRISVVLAAGIGLLTIWVPQVLDWFETAEGARIGGSALTILFVLVINALLWEGANRLLMRTYLEKSGAQGQRLRTLLPLIRRFILVMLIVISTLTILTEIGINIAPLLAGAGVIGIAIGFGSQKLVQDCITGLFIILEDAIALGDVVTIEAHSGVVEDMTLRTIRLRDLEGAVHILPFSEVRTILNRSKGFAYAVLDVDVAFGTDLQKVAAVVKRITDDMRTESEWAQAMVDDTEIMGVERVNASSITFRFRQRVPASKQWDLKRQLLARVHREFRQEGIEIPYPTVMQVGRNQPAKLADSEPEHLPTVS